MRLETLALHSGFDHDPTTHATAVPIYQTTSYSFDSADHGAALFNLETEGYRYSRISNPTVAVLEARVAEMEGGTAAIATASGQAALHLAFITVADRGGNIVSTPQIYGATHTLLGQVLAGQGIEARFAKSDSPDAIAKLIDDRTRAVFCESIGNPAGNICDIEGLARVAHAHGVPLIVDNTVATPVLLRPFEHGADIIVHSLTKFMGGHGTTMGVTAFVNVTLAELEAGRKSPGVERPEGSCRFAKASRRSEKERTKHIGRLTRPPRRPRAFFPAVDRLRRPLY